MKLRKSPDELILRGGAFAATVLCVICVLRILRADAAASGGSPEFPPPAETTAVTSAAGTSTAATAAVTATAAATSAASAVTTTAGTSTAAVTTLSVTASTTTATSAAATAAATTAAAPDPAERAALFAGIPVNNDAGVSYDTDALAEAVPAFAVTDEPLVLIVHTHGSEAYADTADDGDRSQDITRNVVHVGEVLCQALNDAGVPALHDETMYDVPSYTKSYNQAAAGIQAALEQYPSVQIVLDVHRDAYEYPDGHLLATSQEFSCGRAARIMFLVGTDAGTLEHPAWRQHLAFAMALQTRLDALEPGLTRPVNLRRQRFNEHLSPGSLLVEIGASGDTLAEACAAAEVLAKALARELGVLS